MRGRDEQHRGGHEHDEHPAHRDLQPDAEPGVLQPDGGDVRPEGRLRGGRCGATGADTGTSGMIGCVEIAPRRTDNP